MGRAIEYESFEGEIPDADLDGLVALHDAVFGVSTSTASFRDRLAGKHGLLSSSRGARARLLATRPARARRRSFYSCLGGVAAHARPLGIASELMRGQHGRARALGYRRVVTETKNEWREMMILDLRHASTSWVRTPTSGASRR